MTQLRPASGTGVLPPPNPPPRRAPGGGAAPSAPATSASEPEDAFEITIDVEL